MVALPAYAAADKGHQDAKTFYNSGTGYYGKGDYEAAIRNLSEAISDYSKAISLHSRHPGYYFERCNALIVKGHFDGAVADCSEAISLSPIFPRGLCKAGET